jgi:hypothetical protein
VLSFCGARKIDFRLGFIFCEGIQRWLDSKQVCEGRGLVEAEDDLRQTNPPTHPELFDALAKDFVAHKFDIKHLIRTIALSAAYQRTSLPSPGNATDDRYHSRYQLRRLSA